MWKPGHASPSIKGGTGITKEQLRALSNYARSKRILSALFKTSHRLPKRSSTFDDEAVKTIQKNRSPISFELTQHRKQFSKSESSGTAPSSNHLWLKITEWIPQNFERSALTDRIHLMNQRNHAKVNKRESLNVARNLTHPFGYKNHVPQSVACKPIFSVQIHNKTREKRLRRKGVHFIQTMSKGRIC